MTRSVRLLFAVAVAGVLTAATGCSGDEPSTPPVSTTLPPLPDATAPAGDPSTVPASTPGGTAATGNAVIVRFELPARVDCEDGQRLAVPVRYETTGAAQVVFVVDREQAPGRPELSGEYAISLTCDGTAHTVVLTAIDAAGRSTIASKAVLTGPAS